MSKSDFFVVITIILAIVALFSEQNRKFHLMKFSKRNKMAAGVLLLIIHLFVWSEKWTCWKGTVFDIYWFPLPSTYAYVLFILLLFFFIWKIGFAAFPLENHPKLLNDYIRLLGDDKISLLASLIDKYHIKDILSFLKEKNNLRKGESQKMKEEQNKQLNEVKEKKSRQKEMSQSEANYETEEDLEMQQYILENDELWYNYIHNDYIDNLNNLKKKYPQYQLSDDIFEKIIKSKDFIKHVVNFNPIYFCPFIKLMDEKNDEFINDILEALMKKKDEKFFNEVNKLREFEIDDGFVIDQNEFPLLHAVFSNPDIAIKNSVWYSVCEEALIELREEKENKVSYLLYEEPDNDYSQKTLLSKSKIVVAIHFLEIMGTLFLIHERFEGCWGVYYENYTRMLLEIMCSRNESCDVCLKGENAETPVSEYSNKRTIAFYLIENIIESICDLYKLSTKKKSNYIQLFENCKKRQIDVISKTDKLSLSEKEELIEKLEL